MSLEDVRAELASILSSITGVKKVYYESPTIIDTTPAVAILLRSGSEEYDTTCENTMNIGYVLRAMVEKKDDSDNGKAQTDKLLALLDDILDEVRKRSNTTLNGDSYSVLAEWGEIGVGDAGNGIPVYYSDILVNAKTLKSIV